MGGHVVCVEGRGKREGHGGRGVVRSVSMSGAMFARAGKTRHRLPREGGRGRRVLGSLRELEVF
jgi:hypothetical protein